MSTSNQFLDTLWTLFFELQVSRYMAAAGLTIMAYDWALTLSVEIRYIWKARWTVVKAIFLINRYLLPLTVGFGFYGWSGKATWVSVPSCKAYVLTDAYTMLTFFSSLHWIVAMRAWALWSRKLMMGTIIWGTFLLYLGATAVLTAKALLAYRPTPVFGTNVCFGDLPDYLWTIWLPSIVFETVIFGLTALKAIQHSKKKVETPILTVLYRDGFLYFIFICLNSFLNLLIWAVAPEGYVILFKFFSTSICAVAGAHLILDLIHVGHLTGASQKSGQPPPKIKGIPGLGYTSSRGEVFEMMSAPSFMQDPPEYSQTIDQIMSTRSMNDWSHWTAPVEWRSFYDRSVEATDANTSVGSQAQTALLTQSEQAASRGERDGEGDNYSFPPQRVKRKSSNWYRANTSPAPGSGPSNRNSYGNGDGDAAASGYHPQRPQRSSRRQLKISDPVRETLVKNGAPLQESVPSSPPPAFTSPTTYRAQQSFNQPQQMHWTSTYAPASASGARSPIRSPGSPPRERMVKFPTAQHLHRQYRSSPDAI